ncbi:MAG: hypothetical protein AB1299_01825 [Thermoproteota archaeon]
MNKTKDIVVGLGEIGAPILKLLSQSRTVVGYDIKKEMMDEKKFLATYSLETDFLHICIPFTKRFVTNVLALTKQFKPKGIVIHSTIEPNTTKKLQDKLSIPVIYSATRGVHRRMLYDLKRYTKFYAIENNAPNSQWAIATFEKTMAKCGVKTKRMSNPLTLELAKIICDTSYYGWLISYAQISNMIAMKNNVSYDEMWSFADEIHKFLGNRPKMYPGVIGGHCLSGNEIIFIKTQMGMRPITIKEYVDSDLSNDVLSYDLKQKQPIFDKVTLRWKREFSGTMVTLISRTNRSITSTDEHIMICSDNLTEKLAKDVSVNEYVPFLADLPKISIKNNYEFKTNNWQFKYNRPPSIKLTPEFCRLLGYYVAEGSVSNYGKGYQLRFSFNKNESNYIQDVCNILRKLGLNYFKYTQNNVTHITIKSTPFSLFISDTLGCGRFSNQKCVPDFIYFVSREHKEEFISGYLRGDGSFMENIGMVSSATSSRILSAGFDILLLSMGYVMTNIQTTTSASVIDGRMIRGGQLYMLVSKKQDQYNSLAKVSGFDTVNIRTHSKNLWHIINDNLFMIKTTKTIHEECEQEVYSIDTKNHLFVSTNGRLIHNCVIPNLDLVNNETLNFIKTFNNKYMKIIKKPK